MDSPQDSPIGPSGPTPDPNSQIANPSIPINNQAIPGTPAPPPIASILNSDNNGGIPPLPIKDITAIVDTLASIDRRKNKRSKNNLFDKLLEDPQAIKPKPLINAERLLLLAFDNLSDTDRFRIIHEAISSKRDDAKQELVIETAKADLSEKVQTFQMRKWGMIGIIGLGIIGVIAVLGSIIYTSLTKGGLDESGTLSGLLNILSEAIKVLFPK